MSKGRPLIVTPHAIERYRQRVADIPDDEIIARLSGRAFEALDALGRGAVILPTGHRAIVDRHAVITVLPLGGRAFHGVHR